MQDYYDKNELYDMENDPDQEHNLIDDPVMIDIVLTMRKRMKSWFIKYSDPDKDALIAPSAVDLSFT